MARLKDSLTDTRRFRVWASTPSELLPVLDALEAQYAELRNSYIDERTRYAREALDRAERDLATSQERVADDFTNYYASRVQYAEREVAEAEARLREATSEAERFDMVKVHVKLRGGAERDAKGRPQEVVEYLAPLPIRDLTVSTPAGSLSGHRITVNFRRDEGALLTVTSEDSRWAAAALAEVGDALAVRVPSWRWARSWWVVYPVVLFAAIVLSTGVARALPKDQNVVALFIAAAFGLAVAGAFVGIRRLLPAFELAASGAPRGRRVVGLVAGWVTTVVLGVITNRISG
ncbi:cytochrome d ubiquinol oxidase subunit II [Curtobacterium sp. MCBD17_003]|uniref:cytochrome d ubiquinol oxidase subunit II n=1 Tax=Curtobacterium sp. MCBD17_003 TaxID=2175667 RepID=UPI0011B720FA|nr:cytochrome d ubiquinol oxidase subunit II [Curtobacterium sp. MCBD17_003]WIE53443.1 hypothetical protein DEI88_009745 [Curtobacterium sp. MCBD17_003]